MLESMYVDIVVVFLPPDVVNLHRPLIELATIVACCAHFVRCVATKFGVKIVIQRRIDVGGLV